MTSKKSISCVVLVYENLNVIFESINSLIAYKDVMDIHVIENRSITSSMTIPYFRSLVRKNKINSYFIFDGNITNNAYDVVLHDHEEVFGNKFTIITDGDVVADDGWLDESLALLTRYNKIFCCSVRMKTDGWNEKVKLGFDSLRKIEHEDWIETPSGIWLCSFRTEELRSVTKALRDSELRFRDAYLHAYSANILGKKWGTTKNAQAQELNRSLYGNSDYILRKNKDIKTNYGSDHYKFWGHDSITEYTVYTANGAKKYSPSPLPASRPNSENIESDAIIKKINYQSKLSCWIDVDKSYARTGWVNVGRFGPKSFYSSETRSYYVSCDVTKQFPAFENVFAHIFCYLLLGRLNELKRDQILDSMISCVAEGGEIRIVELDLKYIEKLAKQHDLSSLNRLAAATPALRSSTNAESLGQDILSYWRNERGRRKVDVNLLREKFVQRGFTVELGRGNPKVDPNGVLNDYCWCLLARKS